MKWRSLEETSVNADYRPLQELLTERKELIARYVSQETQAVHARVIADLKRRGIEQRIISVGSAAPSFELPNQNGKTVASSDLLSHGKLAICFFRGRWCPFCVAQLEAMNQIWPHITAAGANLVAISPQTVQQSFFMTDQHRLQFPLLSDSGNGVARRFGVVYRVPDEQQVIYRRAFINLPFANGDDSWELPIPATFMVGREGRVLYAAADADYTQRPEPADILARLGSANI